MPLMLPVRHTDRTEIETAAQKLQRAAFKRTPLMSDAIAVITRQAMRDVDLSALIAALNDRDWHAVAAAIPALSSVPVVLTKAAGPTGGTGTSSTATQQAAEQLAQQLLTTFGDSQSFAASFAPRLDLVDPRMVSFAQERAGRFLSDLDANALVNAREAVAFGIENGRTVRETARLLQDTMYLPPRGMAAVENYFKALVAQVEMGKGLDEAARQAAKARALAPTKFLDARNIDTLTQRYADRWVKYTADTVARTMTIEASNAGLVDGWTQAAEKGYFDASTATLVWYATDDDVTCPICADLDGTEAAFPDGGFGDVDFPPEHPDCRCTVVLITPDGVEVPADDGVPDLADAVDENGDPIDVTAGEGDVGPSEDVGAADEPVIDTEGVGGDLAPVSEPVDVGAETAARFDEIVNAPALPTPGAEYVAQPHAQWMQYMSDAYPNVDLQVSEHGSYITIDRLVGPKGSTESRAALNEVLARGDALGLHVSVTPSAAGEGNVSALGRWYRQSGFVKDTGKEYGGTMVRITTEPPPPNPVDVHRAWIDALRASHPDTIVQVYDVDVGGKQYLQIDRLIAPKGSTEGRATLRDILAEADRRGVPVVVTPSGAGEGNAAALGRFYRQSGFVKNEGRYGVDEYVRLPEGVVAVPEVVPPVSPEYSGAWTMSRDAVTWMDDNAEARFGPLLDDVGNIHAYLPEAPNPDFRLQVRNAPKEMLKSARGGQAMANYGPGENIVRVGDWMSNGGQQFNFLHEFGHSFDRNLNAVGLDESTPFSSIGRFGGYFTESSFSDPKVSEAMMQWEDVVRNSKAIRDSPIYYGHNKDYLRYYNSTRETWARSYSQYMAERLGGQPLMGLRELQFTNGNYQWADEDFKPIGAAVENVLRALGLLK